MIYDYSYTFGVLLLTDRQPQINDFASSFDSLVYQFPLLPGKSTDAELEIKVLKAQKLYSMISCQSEASDNLVQYGCSFGINKASRAMFVHDKNDRVKKAFKGKESIKVLSIACNGESKHFPIIKKRLNMQEITGIQLITEDQNTLKYGQKLADQDLQSEFFGDDFFTTHSDFDKDQNSYVQISRNRIRVFDPDGQLSFSYNDLNFSRAISIDQRFIYASVDRSRTPVEVTDHKTG